SARRGRWDLRLRQGLRGSPPQARPRVRRPGRHGAAQYRRPGAGIPRAAGGRAECSKVSEIPRAVKPSIIVLPFTNMSGDPQQEFFVDGLTEDILTDLSRFHELFVISRNTSFKY